jgi:endonuclease IV
MSDVYTQDERIEELQSQREMWSNFLKMATNGGEAGSCIRNIAEIDEEIEDLRRIDPLLNSLHNWLQL